MRITITIDLPGVPDGIVPQPVVDITTRPDAHPCQCRRDDADRPDWFADQARRERLQRRKGTVLEGRDGA